MKAPSSDHRGADPCLMGLQVGKLVVVIAGRIDASCCDRQCCPASRRKTRKKCIQFHATLLNLTRKLHTV
jgi:hypothetical protein